MVQRFNKKAMEVIQPKDKVELERNGVKYFYEKAALQSVHPPEAHFGFTYWSLMIPPFKPERMLMLGCGQHTIPRLIRKIWGEDVLETCNEHEDAFEFVKKQKGILFDYIIIDLFDGGYPAKGILNDSFVEDIATISSGLVAINSSKLIFHATNYRHKFDLLVEKKLKNNVVTFMALKGSEHQSSSALPPF